MRARLATLILVAGVSLGGCAYGGNLGGLSVGTSYGNAYGSPYGYGHGVYGSPYYAGGYGYGSGYGGYGYGGYGYDPFGRYNPYYRSPYYGSPYYGSPYLGWYDGFYYPGNGYYVYDRDNRRRRLSDAERRRWVAGIAELAARHAREGQTTSGSTTATSSAGTAPAQQRIVRRSTSPSAASRIGEMARARAEARSEMRSTSRSAGSGTMRSSSPRSGGLGSTLRRRLESN